MRLPSALVLLTLTACFSSSEPEPVADGEPLPAQEPPAEPTFVHLEIPEREPVERVQPGDGDVSVWMDTRSGAVRLRFSDVMVEDTDGPVPFVVTTPELPGEWVWESTDTLMLAVSSTALPAGTKVHASVTHERLGSEPFGVGGHLEHFRFGGKVASWPVVPGEPRFVGFVNLSSLKVGSGPLLVLFDQPVTPDAVLRDVRIVDDSGHPLAVRVASMDAAPYAWDEPFPEGHVVALSIPDLPDEGQVTVTVPSGTSEQTWPLTIASELSIDVERFGMWSDDDPERMPVHTAIHLSTSQPVLSQALERAVRIEPEPLSMRVSSWGQGAQLDLHLEEGTAYTLVVDGVQDALGNTQPEPLRVPFKSQDKAPRVGLPQLAVNLEEGRPDVAIRGLNVEGVEARAWPLDTPALARALRDGGECMPDSDTAQSLAVSGAEAPLNTGFETTVSLPGTGAWCVEVSGTGTGTEAGGVVRDRVAVQVSDLAVTAKVSDGAVTAWVTDVATGTPKAGVPVSLRMAEGNVRTTATTDASGLATLDTDVAHVYGVDEPIVVSADGEAPIALWVDEGRLSSPWRLGLPTPGVGVNTLAAAVFTERGAYRPGEDVQLSVVAGPSLANTAVQVTVTDAQGQEQVSESVQLDDYGTGHLAIGTEETSSVGRWSVLVRSDEAIVRHTFRVEEYRVPTFEVTADAKRSWDVRERVDVDLSAAYLHGGQLDGRAIRWEVRREAVPFAPRGYSTYQFASTRSGFLAGSVASGNERLDGSGHLGIHFTPDHPASAGPVRYTVDATVTDVDRQAYLGRTSRTVHPADFYVGIERPQRAIAYAGEPLSVPVVVLTPDGRPVSDVPVRVRLERVDHHMTTRLGGHSAQTLTREVARPVADCVVTTTETGAVCDFVIPEAGQWVVRAWARDGSGNDVATSFDLRAGGGKGGAWPRFDHERVRVVADKAEYVPGDVARLIVESPFDEATALVTLERDGILSHQVVPIQGDTPVIEVPITADLAPNVYATVSVVRGRMHDDVDASGFATGAPAFRLGSVELGVALSAQQLDVAVSPSVPVAAPGDTVDIDLELLDAQGIPVTGQAVVMVVDEAVLGLTAMATPDPLAGLYPDAPLGVRTADSRLEMTDAMRARHEVLFPGGDGGAIEGQLPANLLRTLFESTAFFDAAVPITDGVGSVSVPLPDNTTTYRVMAVVVDQQGRAGSSDAPLVVKKPVMVQPVIPRFAYAGDTMTVEAIVHNGTLEDAEALVSGTITGGQGGLEPTRVSVPAGGTATVQLPLTVQRGEETLLAFTAEMGEYTDAVQVSLPILEPGMSRTQVVSTSVQDTGDLSVTLPPDRIAGSESLELVASTTSLTELKDAVQYLMGYPNGCIEQTTSRAYPLVMLEDLLPEIGVEVDSAELREYSEAGIARILSFQTEGGGLSYWPGGTEPHAFATSFGLTALIEAKKKGYDVPDEALVRMGDYLVDALSRGDVTESIPHGNIADGDTRALFVMTLGRLGRPQPAWVERLWTERDKLTPFGLSFLGVAAMEMNSEHPLAEPILAEVERRAQEDAQAAWFEGNPRGGYSMDSPLRSHATALLAAATGKDGMSGKYLQGLLDRRNNGLWGNTQENVFGVMAIATLSKNKTDAESPGLTLSMNGTPVDPAGMAAPSPQIRRQTWGAESLHGDTFRVDASLDGGTPATLTLRASYDLQLTEENRAPVAHGATVTRTYTTLEGEPLDGMVPLGSLVLVTLDVTTEEALNYVAIDDKLPAGLEPLNASLATTERVDLGSLPPEVERGLGLLSYQEIRDHRVAFYADELPAGDVSWQYVARATTPGTFLRPAAGVEAMYDPETFARSAADTVVVR